MVEQLHRALQGPACAGAAVRGHLGAEAAAAGEALPAHQHTYTSTLGTWGTYGTSCIAPLAVSDRCTCLLQGEALRDPSSYALSNSTRVRLSR